ncbi:DUF6907 domain-containing protein [Streptomyces prasinus]|uniref:DUF6907 domain-containing protein n=1 Tax=Streptomyces prasinus TaxID=67345 RepID=UPI00362C8B99
MLTELIPSVGALFLAQTGLGRCCATGDLLPQYGQPFAGPELVLLVSWIKVSGSLLLFGRLLSPGTPKLYSAETRAEYTEDYKECEPRPMLCAHLVVSPDSTVSPACRVAHVLVEGAADMYTGPMDLNQLAGLFETVSGQLEELRAMHPRLTTARAG